jgi:hypothetical protein
LSCRRVTVAQLIILLCLGLVAAGYAHHVDWPSMDGAKDVREYLPEQHPLDNAHHYTLRAFMDSWELFRYGGRLY